MFFIYYILQKYGVRLETLPEKFEESAIGRFFLLQVQGLSNIYLLIELPGSQFLLSQLYHRLGI